MSSAGVFSRSLRPGDVCSLTYHGLFPEGLTSSSSPTDGTLVTSRQFRRQLRFLKSRYHLITPEMFRAWCSGDGELPARAVLLTCDDGLLNVLTAMVPILIQEQVKCLFFVTGASAEDGPAYLWYEDLYQILKAAGAERVAAVCREHLGRNSTGDRDIDRCWQSLLLEFSRLSCQDRRDSIESLRMRLNVAEERLPKCNDSAAEQRYRLLSRAELQQLVAAGMTIGAHTMSHPMLSEMTPELVEYEVGECRSRLESYLQQEVWALAYPFGDEGSTGAREAKIAENAGYRCAFMNGSGGTFGRATPKFRLPRTHVTSAMEIPEMEARLTGFFEPIRKRVAAVRMSGKDA